MIICPCPEQDYEINLAEDDLFRIGVVVRTVGSKNPNEVQNLSENQDEVENTEKFGSIDMSVTTRVNSWGSVLTQM